VDEGHLVGDGRVGAGPPREVNVVHLSRYHLVSVKGTCRLCYEVFFTFLCSINLIFEDKFVFEKLV
jgi:hypothetical protein